MTNVADYCSNWFSCNWFSCSGEILKKSGTGGATWVLAHHTHARASMRASMLKHRPHTVAFVAHPDARPKTVYRPLPAACLQQDFQEYFQFLPFIFCSSWL